MARAMSDDDEQGLPRHHLAMSPYKGLGPGGSGAGAGSGVLASPPRAGPIMVPPPKRGSRSSGGSSELGLSSPDMSPPKMPASSSPPSLPGPRPKNSLKQRRKKPPPPSMPKEQNFLQPAPSPLPELSLKDKPPSPSADGSLVQPAPLSSPNSPPLPQFPPPDKPPKPVETRSSLNESIDFGKKKLQVLPTVTFDPAIWIFKVGKAKKDSTDKEASAIASKVRQNVELVRKSGIPPSERANIWEMCCKAREKRLAPENKEYYSRCVDQLSHHPTKSWKDIEKDVKRTMQTHPFFKSQEGMAALTRVLGVFSFRNPMVGYCQSMNQLAAKLLLIYEHDEERVFWMLDSLIVDILPEDYYTNSMIGVRSDCVVLSQLCLTHLPRLADHLSKLEIGLDMVSVAWLMCIYVDILPDDIALRVWDLLIVEGSSVLLRVALAILHANASRLLKINSINDVLSELKDLPSHQQIADEFFHVAFELIPHNLQIARLRSLARKPLEKELLDNIKFKQSETKKSTGQTLAAVGKIIGNSFSRLKKAVPTNEKRETLYTFSSTATDMSDGDSKLYMTWMKLIGKTRISNSKAEANEIASKVRQNVELVRKSGIPPSERANIWEMCCKAREKRLAPENKEYYSRCVDQLSHHPTKSWKDIEKDVKRTMQTHPFFKSQEGMAALTRVLGVFSFRNPMVGYCQSMNQLAAKLLLIYEHDEERVFWMLDSLIVDILPEDYYTNSMIGVQMDCSVLLQLCLTHLPSLTSHFSKLNVNLEVACVSWFMCLYADILPDEIILRVWDLLIVEGSSVLLRVALAILHLNSSALIAVDEAGEVLTKLDSLVGQVPIGALFELVNSVFSSKPIPEARIEKTRKSKRKYFTNLLVTNTKFISLSSNSKSPTNNSSLKNKLGNLLASVKAKREHHSRAVSWTTSMSMKLAGNSKSSTST